ncbi:hypothetical protein MTO96_043357 [Rhipicephalus appendiculatus]
MMSHIKGQAGEVEEPALVLTLPYHSGGPDRWSDSSKAAEMEDMTRPVIKRKYMTFAAMRSGTEVVENTGKVPNVTIAEASTSRSLAWADILVAVAAARSRSWLPCPRESRGPPS